MIIVESGEVVEFSAEPGQFAYQRSTEPSLFVGDLGEGIQKTFQQIGRRFEFGGDTGNDQRVYYFNTKEIIGNKYGTPSPIPFRVVDRNIGLDVDISVRCNGEYSYRITDPLLFYKNVCGNVEDVYTRDRIDSQLRSELLTALQPAFAKVSEEGIRYSAIPAHTKEVATALNEELSESWTKLRGISIVAFGVNSINASEEDQKRIKDLQSAAVLTNPTMAAANLAAAQGDAMRAAAAPTKAGRSTGSWAWGWRRRPAVRTWASCSSKAPSSSAPQRPLPQAPQADPQPAAGPARSAASRTRASSAATAERPAPKRPPDGSAPSAAPRTAASSARTAARRDRKRGRAAVRRVLRTNRRIRRRGRHPHVDGAPFS
jgi:membrane protease subunit (stomatin/prohibitin family)